MQMRRGAIDPPGAASPKSVGVEMRRPSAPMSERGVVIDAVTNLPNCDWRRADLDQIVWSLMSTLATEVSS